MTWTTAPESTDRARALLNEEGRTLGPVPYELALYALVRSGATRSHRELGAGYLNLYAQLLDTGSVESHS
jgi:hypothetical protein